MKRSSASTTADGGPSKVRAWAGVATVWACVAGLACGGASESAEAQQPAGAALLVDPVPSAYRLRTAYRAEMRVTAQEGALGGETPYRTENANPPGSERVCSGEIEYREDGELGTREYLLCKRSTVTSRDPDLLPGGEVHYPEDRTEHGAFEGCTVAWPTNPSGTPVASCKSGAPEPREDELRQLRRARPGLFAALGGESLGDASFEPGRSWDLPVESVRELVLMSQPPWLEGSDIFPPALIDPFGALRGEGEGGGKAKLVAIETLDGGPAVARIELDLELRGWIPTTSSRVRDDRTSSELELEGTLLVHLAEPRSATLHLAGPLRTVGVTTMDWQGTPLVARLFLESAVVIEQTLTPEARASDPTK